MRGWRSRLGLGTVRSRVTAITIALTTLSMVFVGALITFLQYDDALDTAYARLEHSENEVRQFAERSMSADSRLSVPTSGEDFVIKFLQQQYPIDNEGMTGYVDGVLSYHQGSAGITIQDDAELADFIAPLTSSTTTVWTETTTADGRFLVLVVPVVVGDTPPAALAFVYAVDDEIAPVWNFLRTFIIVSVATIVLAGLAAWLLTGRVMKPLANLRRLTTEITEHNLDGRLPVGGDQTEDLAEVSRSFNSMVDRMQAAFSSQYQLLDDAGHELRTPVTIVQGHLEVMDVEDPSDVSATRDLALAELERMKRLTNDLVLLAKTERPDFLHLEPVDVADLTSDVLTHARQLGQREWTLGRVAGVVSELDPQRITQAWIQLAANAVKFSETGSGIELSSTVKNHATGERVLYLSVRDEGQGIDQADFDKIFDRFGRVDASASGAGLGLSIVRGIAKAHSGDVEVESVKGEGSTFSLVLPLDRDHAGTDLVTDPRED